MHACPGSYNIGFVCVRVHVWLLVELGELWRLKCAGLVGWLGGWLVGWLGGLVGGFEGCLVGFCFY